jgi:hypothetical protein
LLSKKLKIKIYRSIILPVVLYGCETWSVTSRQEHRLRVLQNTVVKKIFGPKRDEVLGEWRRLNNKVYDLYSSPNIILCDESKNEMGGACSYMGDRGAYRVLMGKPEDKRPLGKPRNR